MSKKRFYYNTFYHADDMSRVLEYEIIDRQSYPNYPNHNEREDIPNWYIYIDENDSGWQDMLVELLNTLHEENERLKQSYIQLEHRHSLLHDECLDVECDRDSYHKDVLSLEKENEKLKRLLLQFYTEDEINAEMI